MCGPAIGLIVGIAQQVASFGAAQAEYNAKAATWKQNYINALAEARDHQQSITLRQTQEEAATNQKLGLSQIEEAKKKAEVTNAAAAGNVSGLSVDALVREQGAAAGANRATIESNFEMATTQLQKEKEATNITALNRINSMPRPTAPNPLGLALGIAGAGVKAYGSM